MKLLAVMGTKKSGKTALAEFIIRRLSEEGYSVAAIKHIHHAFTMDIRGKDTWRFGRAGARLVISVSPREIATLKKVEGNVTLHDLVRLVRHAGATDVLVFEGFREQLGKAGRVPKIVTAKDEAELNSVLQGLAGRVIAISGIVAASLSRNPEFEIPVIDTVVEGDRLMGLVRRELSLSPRARRHRPTSCPVPN